MATFAYEEQPRIDAVDPAENHYGDPPIYGGSRFGSSVAISADGLTLIVGAPGVGADGTVQPGAAYAYGRASVEDTWTLEATFSFGSSYAWVGYSVAVSGDGNTAIIGAPFDGALDGSEAASPSNGPFGSAAVFVRSSGSWSLQQILDERNATTGGWFGMRVDLTPDGDTAAVGDYLAQRVNIYVRSGGSWSGTALAPPTSSPGFGFSLDFASDVLLIVGAPGAGSINAGGHTVGNAFIVEFIAGSWTVTVSLSRGGSTWLGMDVAASPTRAVATGFPDSGAAAVVIWETSGAFEDEFTPPIAQPTYIGYRAVISEDNVLLIAGGYESFEPPTQANSSEDGVLVYSLEAGSWHQWGGTPFLPAGGSGSFGNYGLAITPDTSVIAAGGHLEGFGIGAAYTFLDDQSSGAARLDMTVTITASGFVTETLPAVNFDDLSFQE